MGAMVEFAANGRTTGGYLATPASGSGPGVIVIQEWWGLVPHVKDVADRLAGRASSPSRRTSTTAGARPARTRRAS